MEAGIEMVPVSVSAHKVETHQAISLIERVASFSCPSISGHSLSAVAPDYYFKGGTAEAA